MSELADAILRGKPQPMGTFQTMLPAAPGFADTVEQPDGTVNSSLIADPDILAAVQAISPTVAALYYADAPA